MREVKVWGAVHSDEWQSLALINGLRRAGRRTPGLPVHALIPHNHEGGFACRGKHNVNFGGLRTDKGSVVSLVTPYTQERAARMKKRSYGAYTNIDAHQILDHGVRTAYIDLKRGVSPIVLGFLQLLGVTALVGTEGWGLQACVRNSFALEATYEYGDERDKVIDAMHRLSLDPEHPIALANEFDWFQYVGDLDDNTFPHVIRDPFRGSDGADLKPLGELPESVAVALGIGGMAVRVLNWRDFPIPAAEGIWGEVVTPIPNPDTTMWPRHRTELIAAAEM